MEEIKVEEIKVEETKNTSKTKKPSKKLIVKLAAGAFALVLLAGGGVLAAEKIEDRQEQKAQEAKSVLVSNQAKEKGLTLMTEDEAKQLALETAGVEESQAKRLHVELEEDDDHYGQADFVYEVEFTHNGLEYDIYIDGVEKTILKSEIE